VKYKLQDKTGLLQVWSFCVPIRSQSSTSRHQNFCIWHHASDYYGSEITLWWLEIPSCSVCLRTVCSVLWHVL